MGRSEKTRFIKQVVVATVGACAVCGQPYDESCASVVGHQEDLWFLSLICASCQARGLVAAIVQDSGVLDVTDISPEKPGVPLLERPESTPVDPEYALSLHRFLDSFDGDFKTLFSSENS